MTNNVFWSKNEKTTQQQQTEKQTLKSLPDPGKIPGPLASQSDVLPLDHQDNGACRLKSSYFTVST